MKLIKKYKFVFLSLLILILVGSLVFEISSSFKTTPSSNEKEIGKTNIKKPKKDKDKKEEESKVDQESTKDDDEKKDDDNSSSDKDEKKSGSSEKKKENKNVNSVKNNSSQITQSSVARTNTSNSTSSNKTTNNQNSSSNNNSNSGSNTNQNNSGGNSNSGNNNPTPVNPPAPVIPEPPKEEPIVNKGNAIYSNGTSCFNLINELRSSLGRRSMSWDGSIYNYAVVRGNELITSYSHLRPNGTSSITTAPIPLHAENIGYGQTSSNEIVTDWINSTAHYNSLINNNFIRGACADVVFNGVHYWVYLAY